MKKEIKCSDFCVPVIRGTIKINKQGTMILKEISEFNRTAVYVCADCGKVEIRDY